LETMLEIVLLLRHPPLGWADEISLSNGLEEQRAFSAL